jgi:hypothetical protein
MKHLKNSLVVFAGVLAVTGAVMLFIPSLTKGQKSDVPKSAFSVVTDGAVLSGPDPEGTSYAITSMTVANFGTDISLVVRARWGTTGDCLSFSEEPQQRTGTQIIVHATETVHLSFPQPLILSAKPGAGACLNVFSTSPLQFITVVGYKF